MAAGTRGGLAQMVLDLTRMGDLTTGTDTSDTLTGTAQDDLLIGGAGDDTLLAGTGRDIMYGDTGADVFVFQADSLPDHICGFEQGIDRIEPGIWTADDFIF